MDRESILCEMNDYAVNMPADDFHSLYRNNSVEIGDKKKTFPHFPEHLTTFESFGSYLQCDPTQVASCISYIVHLEEISKYIKQHPEIQPGTSMDIPMYPLLFVNKFTEIIWDKVMIDPKRLMLIGAVINELGHSCLLDKVGKEVSRNISSNSMLDDNLIALTIEKLTSTVIRLINGEKIHALAVNELTGEAIDVKKDDAEDILSSMQKLMGDAYPKEDLDRVMERIKKSFLKNDKLHSDDPE